MLGLIAILQDDQAREHHDTEAVQGDGTREGVYPEQPPLLLHGAVFAFEATAGGHQRGGKCRAIAGLKACATPGGMHLGGRLIWQWGLG